jgi:hypothetical protein
MLRRAIEAIGRWLAAGMIERAVRDPSFGALISKLAAASHEDSSRQQLADIAHHLHVVVAAANVFHEDNLAATHRFAANPLYIGKHNTHVYSQNYEDSIIAEIYARIGFGSRTFVEIGVGDGTENVTRLLLEQGWQGLWIEGGDIDAAIRTRFGPQMVSGQLKFENAMVDAGNVPAILAKHGFGGELDLLSIDVDMNTSHVWRAMQGNARVACIEYNSHYHPASDYEFPYDPSAMWDGTNRFGASLSILEQIGRSKRMSLVGCDNHGVNAFFVRDDLAKGKFIEPFDAVTHFEPPRFPFARQRGHRPASVSRLS